MRVAQRMAGYSAEEADNLRKACAKKIRELIVPGAREVRRAAASRRATTRPSRTQLFDIIEPFADYAFNKPHAYGYGLIAYQTAWCKVHHPVEYLSALLTSVRDDKDRTAVYLAECRTLGIEVTVPDVNLAMSDFTPSVERPRRNRVRARRGAQRRGEPRRAHRRGAQRQRALRDGLRLRSPRRPDRAQQAHDGVAHQRRRVRLVRGPPQGALPRRRGARRAHARAPPRARRGDRDALRRGGRGEGRGQGTWEGTELADPGPGVLQARAAPLREGDARPLRLGPPAAGCGGRCSRATRTTRSPRRRSSPNSRQGDGVVVRVGGVVTDVQRRFSKRGEEWARFTLEDLGGAIEVLCFAKPFHDFGALPRA